LLYRHQLIETLILAVVVELGLFERSSKTMKNIKSHQDPYPTPLTDKLVEKISLGLTKKRYPFDYQIYQRGLAMLTDHARKLERNLNYQKT